MKEAICTIITGNYGHYALALHDSIAQFNPNLSFAVLVTESALEPSILEAIQGREQFIVFYPKDFEPVTIASQLHEKYFSAYHDAYRWGMKPVLMTRLLEDGYERVIYADSDVYFFNDFSFLFDQLKASHVLLSPHWRCSDPLIDKQNFELNFKDGIFNGGFVGASQLGVDALAYWAKLCLFNCEVNRRDGYYVDQRYLDILPTRFDKVAFIEHKGCNVGNWNQVDCERTLDAEGAVLINGKYPIVFIHFSTKLLPGILKGHDTLLLPFLKLYRDNLLRYHAVDIIDRVLNGSNEIVARKDVSEDKKNHPKHYLARLLKKMK